MAQTADIVNLDGVSKHSPIRKLVKQLSVSTLMSDEKLKTSIMTYGKICEHDSGFLCEHRLQYIIDRLKIHLEEE